MRVKSKLADVDFQFGDVKRDGNLLVIDSHPDSTMKSSVYVSPQDVVEVLKRILISPSALLFVLGLPYFLYRWHRSGQRSSKTTGRVKEWPKV
jgi:preprotein translocase subunit Sec63